MTPAAALTVTAAAALLIASRREAIGVIEAGDGDWLGAGFDPLAIVDRGEAIYNQLTEAPATVDTLIADRNVAAFLDVIARAEGTAGRGDYRACYGYAHTIADLSDHPAVTGEWKGERLPDAMCRNAGFGPGCLSSAAGRYQLIKATWIRMRNALSLPDFTEDSQDAAAAELIRRRGALEDVRAGRFGAAVSKCRNEWASLPGNYAAQGQRSLTQLAAWFGDAGGTLA